MNNNETVIREFIQAWSRLDPVELAGYFTDDGIYHNMPMAPVQGREKIEEFIRGFLSSWTETDWDMVNIIAEGDLVVAERVDRTKTQEKSVELPCVGVFELKDGKIKVWRDYFDLSTYMNAMS
jgi:limonene-1,2-epoxide hydrolase